MAHPVNSGGYEEEYTDSEFSAREEDPFLTPKQGGPSSQTLSAHVVHHHSFLRVYCLRPRKTKSPYKTHSKLHLCNVIIWALFAGALLSWVKREAEERQQERNDTVRHCKHQCEVGMRDANHTVGPYNQGQSGPFKDIIPCEDIQEFRVGEFRDLFVFPHPPVNSTARQEWDKCQDTVEDQFLTYGGRRRNLAVCFEASSTTAPIGVISDGLVDGLSCNEIGHHPLTSHCDISDHRPSPANFTEFPATEYLLCASPSGKYTYPPLISLSQKMALDILLLMLLVIPFEMYSRAHLSYGGRLTGGAGYCIIGSAVCVLLLNLSMFIYVSVLVWNLSFSFSKAIVTALVGWTLAMVVEALMLPMSFQCAKRNSYDGFPPVVKFALFVVFLVLGACLAALVK